MLTLALTTLYTSRLHQAHVCTDGKYALEFVCEFLLHCKHAADVIAEVVFADLNLNLKSVKIVDSVHDEHILRLKFLHLKNYAFHLRWEDIDSADDEHIVASSHDSAHAH